MWYMISVDILAGYRRPNGMLRELGKVTTRWAVVMSVACCCRTVVVGDKGMVRLTYGIVVVS